MKNHNVIYRENAWKQKVKPQDCAGEAVLICQANNLVCAENR